MAGATTDFVGTRVFQNLTATTAKIDTRDSTVIGMPMPAPAADNTAFPIDEPVTLSLDNVEMLEKLGPGLARDACSQILSEGIVTDIAFVRTPHSDATDPAQKYAAELNGIVGQAGQTGVHALLQAKSHIGLEPGCIIFPGYGSQRLDDAANAAVVAASTVAGRILDCVVITDTPSTSREAAVAYAADFALNLNVVAMYPQALVNLGEGNVIRPLSPHFAGAMVRRDKEAGSPYKACWNRPLQGVLRTSVPVGHTDGDTSSESNFLLQRGVGTVIERNLLWAPFTTASDPTVNGWRSLKRIRTRQAVDKAVLRALRMYAAEDITPHMVTLIYQSIDNFLSDLVAMGALAAYELIWSKAMNPGSLLQAGALRVKQRFAETPDLVDLGIYSEPQPEGYDILAAAIASAVSQMGRANIRVAA